MSRLNQWKHWPAFWDLVREYDVCPESDKERLGECEIRIHYKGYESQDFNKLCCWSFSGFAGETMGKLYKINADTALINLSTYAPNIAPLPIVKPCHRCGMDHDEVNPPQYCVKILELEGRLPTKEINLCIATSKEHMESATLYMQKAIEGKDARIAELERYKIVLREIYERDYSTMLEFEAWVDSCAKAIIKQPKAQNG